MRISVACIKTGNKIICASYINANGHKTRKCYFCSLTCSSRIPSPYLACVPQCVRTYVSLVFALPDIDLSGRTIHSRILGRPCSLGGRRQALAIKLQSASRKPRAQNVPRTNLVETIATCPPPLDHQREIAWCSELHLKASVLHQAAKLLAWQQAPLYICACRQPS